MTIYTAARSSAKITMDPMMDEMTVPEMPLFELAVLFEVIVLF
jgi:hypothetical protein